MVILSFLKSFSEMVELGHNKDSGRQLFAGTDTRPAINFPPTVTAQWEEQVGILKINNINFEKLSIIL